MTLKSHIKIILNHQTLNISYQKTQTPYIQPLISGLKIFADQNVQLKVESKVILLEQRTRFKLDSQENMGDYFIRIQNIGGGN